MIIYSNPYNSQKNIGKAYNDFIRSLNVSGDTWIVLQDGDMMFLTPNWGAIIEHASYTTGKEYALLGCYTNRVGLLDHLVDGKFSDNMDIEYHRQLAWQREKEYYTDIQPIKGPVAGYFMMFQLNTWFEVGGFEENTLQTDINFSKKITATGGQLGLLKGLYVFHAYRLHRQGRYMAQADHSHLIYNK